MDIGDIILRESDGLKQITLISILHNELNMNKLVNALHNPLVVNFIIRSYYDMLDPNLLNMAGRAKYEHLTKIREPYVHRVTDSGAIIPVFDNFMYELEGDMYYNMSQFVVKSILPLDTSPIRVLEEAISITNKMNTIPSSSLKKLKCSLQGYSYAVPFYSDEDEETYDDNPNSGPNGMKCIEWYNIESIPFGYFPAFVLDSDLNTNSHDWNNSLPYSDIFVNDGHMMRMIEAYEKDSHVRAK